ncbi:MAG: polyphosphate kinase 1 [Chitinophagales bacterium]|nr:polyphosphate kinase 1 [Chitinophagales bacterium]MCZ2393947.1 polyphosphate kinase 1 [Chitinophagales bacterium]
MLKRNQKIHRDISWLSFNERVLQEAESSSVPLLERLKFLGIFSNNMDEFFRIRVAIIRKMSVYSTDTKVDMGIYSQKLLEEIEKRVLTLQKRYDLAYFKVLKEMKRNHISMLNEKNLTKHQSYFVEKYFHQHVRKEIFPILLDKNLKFPVLQDASIYLAVKFYSKTKKDIHYSLLEIPPTINRFIVFPSEKHQLFVMFLDDVIRYNLKDIFKIYDFDEIEAYTIKFNKDAELNLDHDVSESFLQTVESGLKKRNLGSTLRIVYDAEMPEEMLQIFLKKLNFNKQGILTPGVRYHHFKDFMQFPQIGTKDMWNEAYLHVPHPALEGKRSIISQIKSKDIFLYYPYHSFDYFLDLLREAAIDPQVTHIRMSLYRLSKNSHIVKSLMAALKNGKRVTVIIELTARFDEAANLNWANQLKEEGAKVIIGIDGLKVHSKVCLITRKEGNQKEYISCIGTGNFHEDTAKLYTDAHLLTANADINKELRSLFKFLDKNYFLPQSSLLMVSPFNSRKKINSLINREIKNAKSGLKAEIFFKANSIVDEGVIQKLYAASKSGVKVRLIIRGACSLIPGNEQWSKNIKAISIIDRFLEHSRIFIFHNQGDEEIFMGSTDLMTRNIDYRVELMTPIIDNDIKQQVKDLMEIQWQDNVKARIFDIEQKNKFRQPSADVKKLRSQEAVRDYFLHLYQLSKLKTDETGSN